MEESVFSTNNYAIFADSYAGEEAGVGYPTIEVYGASMSAIKNRAIFINCAKDIDIKNNTLSTDPRIIPVDEYGVDIRNTTRGITNINNSRITGFNHGISLYRLSGKSYIDSNTIVSPNCGIKIDSFSHPATLVRNVIKIGAGTPENPTKNAIDVANSYNTYADVYCNTLCGSGEGIGTVFNNVTFSHYVHSNIYMDFGSQDSVTNVTNYTLAYSCKGESGAVLTSFSKYGNITANPRFVDMANNDFRLQDESPCINTGAPALADPNFVVQLDPNGSILDMGAIYNSNRSLALSTEETPATPAKVTALGNAYPNPFNPKTTIEFNMAENGNANLSIYNVKGQLVKTLVNGEQTAGSHKIVWSGTNDGNKEVASGIYFYKLTAGGKTEMKKMMLLK